MISVLVSLLIVILIFGVIWWIINEIPMDVRFLKIARVILLIILLLVLLNMAGFLPIARYR